MTSTIDFYEEAILILHQRWKIEDESCKELSGIGVSYNALQKKKNSESTFENTQHSHSGEGSRFLQQPLNDSIKLGFSIFTTSAGRNFYSQRILYKKKFPHKLPLECFCSSVKLTKLKLT